MLERGGIPNGERVSEAVGARCDAYRSRKRGAPGFALRRISVPHFPKVLPRGPIGFRAEDVERDLAERRRIDAAEYVELREGGRYTVELRASGGLTIRSR